MPVWELTFEVESFNSKSQLLKIAQKVNLFVLEGENLKKISSILGFLGLS